MQQGLGFGLGHLPVAIAVVLQVFERCFVVICSDLRYSNRLGRYKHSCSTMTFYQAQAQWRIQST